ncbi:MAG: response regulator transcription factor [Christensenellales bacterium]|jgi:two-component system response regulator YesN
MNILLVDDQPNILTSLVSCIPWSKLGISEVFTAGSAEEARAILREKKTDILITDIEMPGGSGLELLAWVRERVTDTECILLTSHADFLYAKQAISLKVSDYVLQPARYEDVIQAVRKAVANRSARSRSEELIRYRGQDFAVINATAQSIFENWPTYQESFLQPALLDGQINQLSRMSLHCKRDDPCTILYGHIRSWHRIPLEPVAILSLYRKLLDTVLPRQSLARITWFPQENVFFTVFFAPLTDRMEQALQKVYDASEAEIGCAARMLYCGTDFQHIREALSSLRSEEIEFGLSHDSGAVCLLPVKPKPFSWEIDSMKQRDRQHLAQICRYIEEHMAEPITRTQIAEDLHMSPGYVSHVIKELEDLNCKELITKIKMEFARKLLQKSRFSIGEIAIQCGYDSFAYFSKVYRQTYGITPTMEREGK